MKILRLIASVMLSLTIPIIVIIIAIRVLLSPIYYQVEYRMPYFPPDPYGFNLEDRLFGAQVSIEYLINDAGLDYFNQFRLSDGSPFFNQRELGHMLDVKVLVQNALRVGLILMLNLLVIGLLTFKTKSLAGYGKAVSRGGLLTLILIVSVLVFVILSFSSMFTQFHMLFFTGESWLFEFSDTLIRLFPMQFWQDAFIWVGALSAIQALLFFLLGKRLKRISR